MTLSDASSGGGSLSLPNLIVLDACVVLNLFASGRVEEILASLSAQCLVSSLARDEALWYLTRGEHPEILERRDIDLEPVVADGLLEIVDLTTDEQNAFVELARELGDGEAASGAIAASRSATVATDDARARLIFTRRSPAIASVSTVALLRAWEARSFISRADLAPTLQAIKIGARYFPRGGDIEADWWQDRIKEVPRE